MKTFSAADWVSELRRDDSATHQADAHRARTARWRTQTVPMTRAFLISRECLMLMKRTSTCGMPK